MSEAGKTWWPKSGMYKQEQLPLQLCLTHTFAQTNPHDPSKRCVLASSFWPATGAGPRQVFDQRGHFLMDLKEFHQGSAAQPRCCECFRGATSTGAKYI